MSIVKGEGVALAAGSGEMDLMIIADKVNDAPLTGALVGFLLMQFAAVAQRN